MHRDPEPPAREIPASSLQPPASSRRGGRRTGAGAPKGNLNALRSGTRSKQLRAVIVALLTVPETRRVLLHFSRMEQRKLAQLQMAISRYAWLARRRPERSRKARPERSRRGTKPMTVNQSDSAHTDSSARSLLKDNRQSE